MINFFTEYHLCILLYADQCLYSTHHTLKATPATSCFSVPIPHAPTHKNNLCQSWFKLTSIPWQILGRMSLGEAAPMEMATPLPPLLPGGGLKEKNSHCEVKQSYSLLLRERTSSQKRATSPPKATSNGLPPTPKVLQDGFEPLTITCSHHSMIAFLNNDHRCTWAPAFRKCSTGVPSILTALPVG